MAAEVELGRAQLALSHRDLARRARVSPSTVLRIVRGDPGVQIDTLVAVGSAAGIDVVLRAFPGHRPGLRDRGQLIIAEHLTAIAGPAWHASLEVPAGDHGKSADLVFAGSREVIHVEIIRLVVDFQAQYRAAAEKRDVLAARDARPVRLVLTVEETVRNRRFVRPHQQLVERALPAGTRSVLASLRLGRPLGTDGLLWVRRSRMPASGPGPRR